METSSSEIVSMPRCARPFGKLRRIADGPVHCGPAGPDGPGEAGERDAGGGAKHPCPSRRVSAGPTSGDEAPGTSTWTGCWKRSGARSVKSGALAGPSGARADRKARDETGRSSSPAQRDRRPGWWSSTGRGRTPRRAALVAPERASSTSWASPRHGRTSSKALMSATTGVEPLEVDGRARRARL